MNRFAAEVWQFIKERRWQCFLLICGVLIPLFVFGQLAHWVRAGSTGAWDDATLRAINRYQTPQRDAVVTWLTLAGGVATIPFIVLATAAFGWKSHPRHAALFLVAAAGSDIINWLAKVYFARERPALWVTPTPVSNFSFPSGHAMNSMSIALTISCLFWHTRWRWPVFISGMLGVIAIGFSRLYLGVHYPTDVIGGWLGALLWVSGLWLIFRKGDTHRLQLS